MIGERVRAPWGPARQRLGAAAVLTVTLTAVAGAALGGSAGYVWGAGAWVVTAFVALFFPAWIAVQLLGGQVLAGSLLLSADGPPPLLILPMVAGIIATAELLTSLARMNTPLSRGSSGELRKAVIAAATGAAVFGVVLLVSGIPGPAGLLAIAVASGACITLALLLVSRRTGRWSTYSGQAAGGANRTPRESRASRSSDTSEG